MNVTKMSGGFLVSLGITLMILGSAIFPVNSPVWGDIVVGDKTLAVCRASCNRCGDFETVNIEGETQNVCRDNGAEGRCTRQRGTCGSCTGGCRAEQDVDDDGDPIPNQGECICITDGS